MKQHLPAFLAALSVLAALTGCKPQGPAAEVEDHIDEVMETGMHAGDPPAAPRSEPGVMALQQKRQRQLVEQASQAAEQKLNEILQDARP